MVDSALQYSLATEIKDSLWVLTHLQGLYKDQVEVQVEVQLEVEVQARVTA